jgi:hypothetical protein
LSAIGSFWKRFFERLDFPPGSGKLFHENRKQAGRTMNRHVIEWSFPNFRNLRKRQGRSKRLLVTYPLGF